MLLAVVVGIWPLVARPAVAASAALIVVGTAIAARQRFHATASMVLALAYVSYGVVRAVWGPAVAGIPFWLAAFVGLSLGGASLRTWTARDPWRLPLAWWATGVALSWPVVATREMTAGLAPTPATSAVATAALVQMSVALWMDRLLSPATGVPDGREPGSLTSFERALSGSALATAVAALYQHFGDRSWLSGEPWVSAGRSTGLMGDANPMGVATAIAAPLLVTWVLRGGTKHRGSNHGGSNHGGSKNGGSWGRSALGLGAGLLLWAAAWLSGARSTLILTLFGVIGLLASWAIARRVPARRIVVFSTGIVLAGGLVLALLARGVSPATPIGRLLASVPASPSAAMYELLWRRDGYGLAAVQAIKERPINGIGIGLFTGRSSLFYAQVEPRAIPPDNAQNLWRQTWAERGLLGLAPLLWLTILAFREIVRAPVPPASVVHRAMVVGLGVVLTFGYPLQDAAIAATVGLMVAALGLSTIETGRPISGSQPPTWAWAALIVVCLAGAGLDIALGR
jgi:hypothetical protein